MAESGLTADHPGSTLAVENYLAELDTRLRGPGATRARVRAEVRDGLTDTIATHLAHGRTPSAAVAVAIDEFGDPATVAASFANEMATASARRTIGCFIVTGPLVGIWWLLLLDPMPWRGGVPALLIAIPAIPLIASAIVAAAATFASTGRLIRWLPETTGTRLATAVATVAALCLAADLTVLGILAVHLANGWHGPPALIAVAVSASVARLAAATLVIRSTPAMREQLGST